MKKDGDLRFVAEKPIPLSVHGVGESVVSEEGVGVVVSVKAAQVVQVPPVAEASTVCELAC